MKLFGVKYFICVLFIYSCSTSRKTEINTTYSVYSYVTIPEIEFFAKYFGDYRFASIISREEKRELRPFFRNKINGKTELIYASKTIALPYYKSFLFRINRSVDNRKTDSLKWQNKTCLTFTFVHNSDNYLLVQMPQKDTLTADEAKDYYNEFKTICNKIYTGKGYDKQIELPDFFNEAEVDFFYDSSANYLRPVKHLQRLAGTFKNVDETGDWMALQAELTYNSFLLNGNDYYKTLLNKWNNGTTGEKKRNIKENAVEVSPITIDALLQRCKNQQVIFINENHFMPKHRYLLYCLLNSLKAYGFNQLAIEDYASSGRGLKPSPNQQEGFYIKEPVMGEIHRKARGLGYDIIHYDDFDSKDREMVAVDNLINQTLKKNPKGKFIVLCGIDHLLETPIGNGKKWLAALFKEKTGINPFTINQTAYENFSQELAVGNLAEVKDTNRHSEDLLLLNHLDPFGKDEQEFDLSGSETILKFSQSSGKQREYAALLYNIDEWLKDSIHAVPVRTYFIPYVKEHSPAILKLPEGNFILKIQDEWGRSVEESIKTAQSAVKVWCR